MISLALVQARRRLLRAARLAVAGRIGAALPLARQASDTLRREAALDSRRQGEYAAALIVLADLHLARVELPAALAAHDALVLLCQSPTLDEVAADQLADALTRRGDTLRLQAQYRRAETDLAAARRLACSPMIRAGACNASGILAKDLGQYDAAARYYQASLDLVLQVHGPEHANLADLFHNLAGLEHARQRYVDGEPYARRAIALRERRSGPDSVQLAADLAVLGALLAGQDLLDEAEPIFRRTLATWSRLRGPDHYEVGVALHNLASLHAARGQMSQASTEYQRALQIKRQVLGHSHPEVVALAEDAACHRPVTIDTARSNN